MGPLTTVSGHRATVVLIATAVLVLLGSTPQGAEAVGGVKIRLDLVDNVPGAPVPTEVEVDMTGVVGKTLGAIGRLLVEKILDSAGSCVLHELPMGINEESRLLDIDDVKTIKYNCEGNIYRIGADTYSLTGADLEARDVLESSGDVDFEDDDDDEPILPMTVPPSVTFSAPIERVVSAYSGRMVPRQAADVVDLLNPSYVIGSRRSLMDYCYEVQPWQHILVSVIPDQTDLEVGPARWSVCEAIEQMKEQGLLPASGYQRPPGTPVRGSPSRGSPVQGDGDGEVNPEELSRRLTGSANEDESIHHSRVFWEDLAARMYYSLKATTAWPVGFSIGVAPQEQKTVPLGVAFAGMDHGSGMRVLTLDDSVISQLLVTMNDVMFYGLDLPAKAAEPPAAAPAAAAGGPDEEVDAEVDEL